MSIKMKLITRLRTTLVNIATLIMLYQPVFAKQEQNTEKQLFSACKTELANQRQPHKQFSYRPKTEVVINQDEGFPLLDATERFALQTNKHLNKSPYFDPSFLKNPKKVRQYHTKKKYDQGNIGKLIKVTTEDGERIRCTYFNRGSDTLLIIGEGFTNEREIMSPYLDIFDEFDAVLFDFRGQGYQEFDCTDLDTWPIDLAKQTFGMDAGIATLGKHEEKDVYAVVDYFKKQKKYKNVFGVSLCYSSFIFAKAEALRSGTFDKIILDGCWISLPLLIGKLKKDLKMLFAPQTGGWAQTWPCSQMWMQNLSAFLAENIFCLQLNEVSLLDYLPLIKNTPLLFFYGKDDLMVYRNEFEQLWDATNTEKTAIITSNPHVINHIKQKELFKLISDLFFTLNQNEFVKCLQNVNTLKQHYVNQIMNFAV